MTSFKVIILFIFLSVVGILLIPRINVDLHPSKTLPKFTIYYSLPNSPPEVVEQEATAPLENALSQISNLKKLYSISSQDQGNIEVTFDRDVDLDFKRFEISSIIRHVYPKLNKEISYPIVENRQRGDGRRNPILIYQITSKLVPFQIQKIVEEQFIPELSQEVGVNDISLRGAEGLQITIEYNYEKLKLFDISPKDIGEVINAQFSSFYPGSYYTSSGQKIVIKVENTLNDINQLQNIRLPVKNRFLRLKDVGDVFIEEIKPRQYLRINGLNSVTLSVMPDESINRLELAVRLKQKVSELSSKLPSGYQVELDFDDTKFLKQEIQKNYIRSGLAILILILFTFFAYRDYRFLLIIFSGIAVTLCVTSLVIFSLGIEFHLYSIAGITISFSMMMDNGIMVVAYLHRKRDSKVFKATWGATVTTIIAIMLLLLMQDDDYQNLEEFSLVLSIVLICSLFVSKFYLPAVYSIVFSTSLPKRRRLPAISHRQVVWIFSRYFKIISFISSYRKTFLTFLILTFGLPVFMLPSKWGLHEWYNSTIGSEYYQDRIKPYSDKILGGSLRLFIQNTFERSGYRDLQRTELHIHATLPFGNTLDDMNFVMRDVEKLLMNFEGIDKYITQIWSGQDANIKITFLESAEKGALPYILKRTLIARSLDWSGIEWDIYGVGQGFSNNNTEGLANYRIEMKGYNYNELDLQTQRLSKKLLNHKRIQKVNTNERLAWNEKPSQQYTLDFDWDRLRKLGVFPRQIANTLVEKGHSSVIQSSVTMDGSSFPLLIASKSRTAFSAFDVIETPLEIENREFKLKYFAQLKLDKTSSSIHKENRQYIRHIGFDYYGSQTLGDEYLNKVAEEMKVELPVGYTAKKISWKLDWDVVGNHYFLFLALMLSSFISCAVLFESLRKPLYIIATIPVAFIGVFLIFGFFDFYFDQGGYVSLFLIGGLAINGNIYIINDLNSTRNENYNRNVIKSIFRNFQPLLMTNISTCFCLIPFMIGGDSEVFWFALSVGTIAGLLFSIISTFLVTPVLAFRKH